MDPLPRLIHSNSRSGPVRSTGRWWRLLALSLVVTSPIVHAQGVSAFIDSYRQAASNGKTTHSLDIDNDSLLLTRKDGFYSSGLRYTQEYELREQGQTVRYGWRIGQELYTASDIKLPPDQINPNDHPYASWLYAGIYKQTIDPDGAAWKWRLDLGCLGPCAGGEWTQKTLHRILQQPLPQGWAKQVRNEWGFVLHAEQSLAPWTWSRNTSLTPVLHGRFGNIFTDAGAGLTLRLGRLQQTVNSSALYSFFRLDGRVVGYNASLQGGYFARNNPHTVSPERLVGEVEAGIAWQIPPYGVRISVMRRSNEIRGLTNSQGSQNIGILRFTYSP